MITNETDIVPLIILDLFFFLCVKYGWYCTMYYLPGKNQYVEKKVFT